MDRFDIVMRQLEREQSKRDRARRKALSAAKSRRAVSDYQERREARIATKQRRSA